MKQYTKQLEEHNLRKTPSRLEVLRIMETMNRPLDVSELALSLEKRNIIVDQATIYRTLDSFLEHGLITRHEFQEGKFRYELAGQEHHHLICELCGSVEDSTLCNLTQVESEIRAGKGFLVKKHVLEFFGVCAVCLQ